MNTNTMSFQTFVSVRKSAATGGYYLRFFRDGVAYQAHSQESANAVLAAIGGRLDKTNLVAVQRTRANGEPWEDLQIRFPLDLVVRVDGDANGGAKFATVIEARRVAPMRLSVNLDGVEKRTPNYGAKRAAIVAAESEDADAPATL